MSSGLGDVYGPDKTMCCLCFGGFFKNELWLDAYGEYWDVCKQCKAEEYRWLLHKIKYTIMNSEELGLYRVKADIESDLKRMWDEI
jgi:hypothetical protein